MRQELLAHGYKPSELGQIGSVDVIDFLKGMRKRNEYQYNAFFELAKVAGKLGSGKYKLSEKIPENGLSEGYKALLKQVELMDEINAKK